MRKAIEGSAEQEILLLIPHIHSTKGKHFLESIKGYPKKEWHADFDPTEDYLKFLHIINLDKGKARCEIESLYLRIVCLDLLAYEEDRKFIENIAKSLKNEHPDGSIVINPDTMLKR